MCVIHIKVVKFWSSSGEAVFSREKENGKE
jgi:hypothetical protein